MYMYMLFSPCTSLANNHMQRDTCYMLQELMVTLNLIVQFSNTTTILLLCVFRKHWEGLLTSQSWGKMQILVYNYSYTVTLQLNNYFD